MTRDKALRVAWALRRGDRLSDWMSEWLAQMVEYVVQLASDFDETAQRLEAAAIESEALTEEQRAAVLLNIRSARIATSEQERCKHVRAINRFLWGKPSLIGGKRRPGRRKSREQERGTVAPIGDVLEVL